MSVRAQAETKVASTPPRSSSATATSGLLPRRCACGSAAGMTGECEACGRKKRLGLQTKLKVNEPGDIYEREADRVADEVLATSGRSAVSGAPPSIQRFSGHSSGEMNAAPASVDHALASPGTPLDPALRIDMEQRFGHDFSKVRVHTDAAAAQSAREMDAHAYTVGDRVVFDASRFAPGTSDGRRLLAHELTHVVQQARGEVMTSALVQRQPRPRRVSTSNQSELLNEIQSEVNRSKPREARLTEAFNALEPSYAALVDQAIVSGKLSFQKLPADAGKRLRTIVTQRKAAVPVLSPGVYGKGVRRLDEWDYFIVRHGVTIDEVANYLSDDPKLASVIEAHNSIPHDKVLAAGTLVYFPRDSFKRPGARKQLSQDLRSGSFMYPWGAFKVSHTEPRTYNRDDVLLTKSEWESIRENELQQKHGAEAIEQIAATEEANKAKQLKTDVKRAQKVPNALLSFFFPTSRLYFKDQSSLINNPLLRFQYQTNLRGFDAGTNLYREAGAVAVAANLAPLAILEGYAAVGLLAEAGVGAQLAYGARYVYLNAPTLYGDAMLYGGAALSGAALGQHLLDIRSRGGVEWSDLPRLAEDLTPFFGGWSESHNMRRATTPTLPDVPDPPPVVRADLTPPPAPTTGGRWLRNLYLSSKLTFDDLIPEHANIAGGGSYGRPTPALVQNVPRVTTAAPIKVTDPSTQPDLPSVPTVTTSAPVVANAPPTVTPPTLLTSAPPFLTLSPDVTPPTDVATAPPVVNVAPDVTPPVVTSAPPVATVTAPGSSTTVWVNTRSGRYHLPGSYWYQRRTAEGTMMTLEAARAAGYVEAGTAAAQPPSGMYSVTRPTAGDQRVVIRAWIGDRQTRAGLERQMYSAAEYGLAELIGWQRAHSTGAGLAIESGDAIRLASELVNQALQNRGIEAFLRALRDQVAGEGERLHLQTETTTHPNTLRLSSIHYLVERPEGDRMITLFEAVIEMRPDGSARAGVRLAGSNTYTFGPWFTQ